jgi:DNA processing protein
MQKIKKLPKEKWPKSLLELPQVPDDLWILGELPPEDSVYLCVVGSRRFTSYGKEVCEKIITGLKGYPVVIVSGFAMGIDTIAHKKAIQMNLRTMVFPGSGLSKEVLYPNINLHLVEPILEAGGCFVSEFEPNLVGAPWTFPIRNRLMAGISKAVLIIEAEEKSGTLITARLATEYNRDVLVVPGSVFSPNSKGTNRLLRQGATPITSSKDVLEALGFKQESEIKQKSLFEDLSPEEKKIMSLLREPMPRDELIRNLKMPTSSANTLISILEIKNLIKEDLGNIQAIN